MQPGVRPFCSPDANQRWDTDVAIEWIQALVPYDPCWVEEPTSPDDILAHAEQLEQLRSFPEITSDELIRYFTPTAANVAFVDPGKGRGPIDRLGMLVQLCTLPWLGFVPDDVTAAVARVAERLGVAPAALRLYGKRDQTRSDHLGQVAKYLEWQTAPAGGQAMKELEQFLLDRAMEHDSPTLLFNLAREYLMAAKVIRPGALILAKWSWPGLVDA